MLSFASRDRPPSPAATMSTTLRLLFSFCGLLLLGLSASAQTPEPIVITFQDLALPRTYTGQNQPPVSWTISPGSPDDYTVSVTYNARAALPLRAGAYTVKVVATEKIPKPPLTKKRTASASGKFTVAKAPLTVTALPAGRLFGSANPKLTFTYDGFVNGETFAVLASKPVATTTAKTTSPVGNYPITVVGGSDTDYEITHRVPALLTVVAFTSGTHEALLTGNFGQAPFGRIEITLPTKGATFSGILHVASESLPYSFKGSLILSPDNLGATALATITRAPKTTPPTLPYQYLINVTLDATQAPALNVERTGTDAEIYNLGPLAQVKVHAAKTNPAPWAGTHTFALLDPTLSPTSLSFDYPQGLGYATAIIGTDGRLTLRGKLADDTPLAATLYSSSTGAYLAYLRPYGGRPDSDLSGSFQLIPHPSLPSRYFVPRQGGEASNVLHWRKAEKLTAPPDKNYPDGIEELQLHVALDPWIPPSKGTAATKTAPAVDPVSLAQLLGIADTFGASADFEIDYGTAYLGDRHNLGEIPYNLTLATNNTIRLPSFFTTNPASWKMSVNATTGLFSGSFSLKDEVFGIVKPVTRTVRFQGILRQHSEDEVEYPFAAGYFLLDSLPLSTGEKDPPASHPVTLAPKSLPSFGF